MVGWDEIAGNWLRPTFHIVYGWLRESAVDQVGHNHAVYDRFGAEGMRMRVGFPVSGHFTDSNSVNCMEFGGGTAAHTRHYGAYSSLPTAHAELQQMVHQAITRARRSLLGGLRRLVRRAIQASNQCLQ
jgi:hypothetical protein